MTREIERAIVRILRADGEIFGAGFLVGCNQILTCAHVVADSLGILRQSENSPEQPVFLDFPLLSPKSERVGAVVRYWDPAQDIALLELIEDVPNHAQLIEVHEIEEYAQQKFGVCGFPRRNDGGDWTYGITLGRIEQGYIQLESKTAHRIQGGYSGGPVWNHTAGLLAGMVVASDEREPKDKTAYIIPTTTILGLLPHLREVRQIYRPFRYACFISFPIPQGNLIRPAVQELREDLLGEIGDQIGKDIFVDEGRLNNRYDDSVAVALCESACMIMVYTQRYFDLANPFCAREFRAMELLEEARLHTINLKPCHEHSLIIPIALRGFDRFPAGLCRHRRIYNFENYYVMDSHQRRRRYRGEIAEIARHVVDQCALLEQHLPDPCGSCAEFALPSHLDIQELLVSWVPRYVI